MRLLVLGAAFVTGIFAADRFRPSATVVLSAGVFGGACLTGAWMLHRRQPDAVEGTLLPALRVSGAVALLAGFAALGIADLGARLVHQAASPLTELDGRVRELQGRLANDPQPVGSAWLFTLRSILDDDGRRLPGRLAVRSFGPAPPASAGDLIEILVKVDALDPADPLELTQLRRGNSAQANLLSDVKVLQPSPNVLVRVSTFFRDQMALGARQALDRDRAALLLGLTIGDDRALSPRARDDFRASGLSHLTAVSGANVAIVLGAIAALLAALGAPRKARILTGITTILMFALVTRWEPSVLRASVMAGAVLAAFLFGRASNSLHILSVAFLGLLVFDPLLLWSVGFQLSFVATAGIVLLKDPLNDRLGRLPRPLAEPLSLGLAAQAAVLPFIAVHFDRVSLASVPANLAAAALVAPATVLGLTAGTFSTLSPDVAGPFFESAGLFTGGIQGVARFFGRSQIAQMPVPAFAGAELAAAISALAALWLWLKRKPFAAQWSALGALLLVLASLILPAASGAPEGLRVTFFDVGQGDAALVESPGGARLLIDGGPDPEQVARILSRRGLGRIDFLVASHLHADHVAGLEAVLAKLNVRVALHPGVEAPLLTSLGKYGPWQAVGEGDRFAVGELEVEFLGPSEAARLAANESAELEESKTEGPELNDASAVLRVIWGAQCVLFTGDLEEAGQEALLYRHRSEIDCTVMKAPHHGSARLVEEFIDSADPEWVVVSVGRNDYGHPSEKALEIFEAAGAEVLRTDRLDDVVIEIDDGGRVKVKR